MLLANISTRMLLHTLLFAWFHTRPLDFHFNLILEIQNHYDFFLCYSKFVIEEGWTSSHVSLFLITWYLDYVTIKAHML